MLSQDEDEVVDNPALSALCQSGTGQTNPYANPAPNVDQIVGDTIVTVGSQTGCSVAQNENSIAVNPDNPKNLVAGTNDYRVFNSREQRNDSSGWAHTTFDGGKTWANVQLPHLTFQTGATGALSYMDSAGDPVLGFGPHNTLYYGNIAFSRAAPAAGGTESASAIVLTRRVDVALAGFHGGITPFSQGSNPQVSRNGTLHIAYESSFSAKVACDQPTDRDVTVVATSNDRGKTFKKAVVDTDSDFPADDALGTATLTGENFRINSFPQLAYDPVSDRLAVTWADDRHGSYDATTGESIKTNGDNIVSLSGDGKHWSGPATVGTRQDEVFGAIVTLAGVTAVTSYTRDYDANGINLDYAYWRSVGKHFSSGPIHRITTQSSNPQIQFVGLDDQANEPRAFSLGTTRASPWAPT